MNKRILAVGFFSVIALALAGRVNAAEKCSPEKGRFGIVSYRITFKVTADVLESSGTVVALDRANADYYTRGDIAVEAGENEGKALYSIKNFGSKASFRPSADPLDSNFVNLESQLEIIGPLAQKGAGRQMITMGFQTVTRVGLGKATVIADTTAGRVEVMVEAVK